MKHRIEVDRIDYNHAFFINNGSTKQHFTWWECCLDWEERCKTRELDDDFPCTPKLNQLLKLAGSHTTLWIGDWDGTIAPMDVQPQGWSYPSGDALETEWWWLWHPSETTQKKMVEGFNADLSTAWNSTSPLKSLVPFQTQRNMGEIQSINAIPVKRLPDIMKKEARWIFEFERN